MWLDRLLASRPAQVAELAARFAEERQRVLAENAANLDTPDYHTKRLDPRAFQASLRQALAQAEQTGDAPLKLRGNAQFLTQPDGRIRVQPARAPAPNLLFHDGTNDRLEELMAGAQENALTYDLSVNLLRGRYENLLAAIRGRVS